MGITGMINIPQAQQRNCSEIATVQHMDYLHQKNNERDWLIWVLLKCC